MGKDMANRMDELRSKHSKTLETITRQTLERFESEECIGKEISEVRKYEQESRDTLSRTKTWMNEERQKFESELIGMKRDAMLALHSAEDRLREEYECDMRTGIEIGHQIGNNRKSKMIQSIETHLEQVMSKHQDRVENEIDAFRSSRARLRREMRTNRSRELEDVRVRVSSDEMEQFRVLNEKHEEAMSEAAERHRSVLIRARSPSSHVVSSEEEEEDEVGDVVGCVDVGTRNGRRDLRRRLLLTNEKGQEMFTPLYVHVGESVVYVLVRALFFDSLSTALPTQSYSNTNDTRTTQVHD